MPSTTLRQTLAILVTLIGFGVLSWLVATGLGPPRKPTDRMGPALMAEADRQGFKSDLLARVAKSSPTEARQISFNLARHGIARLSPEQMASRVQLLLALDSRVSDTICAGRFMGTLPASAMEAYFAKLDTQEFDTWVQVSAAGMKADLAATAPLDPINPDQVHDALNTIIASAPDNDRDRLSTIFNAPKDATIADQCWTALQVGKLSLALQEPERTSVLRTLARLEAGP